MQFDDPTTRPTLDPTFDTGGGFHREVEDALLGKVRARLFGTASDRPRQLGRFRLIERLGSGGMGVVYSAYDDELGRRVAVKLLQPGRTAQAEGRARIQQEARAMARLSHPNVVQVFEVGELSDGQVYVVMELVNGQTLSQFAKAPHAWKEILEVYVQAGRGLMAAHTAGLVHRDFKPANAMLGDEGRVRVLDFGLARRPEMMGPDSTNPSYDSDPPREARLTCTGMVVGTPAYMAPEAATEGRVDARSDQYSFCVALYQALYGEHPRFNDNHNPNVDPWYGPIHPAPPGHGVPRSLRRALLRGLSLEPHRRYPSMAHLLRALRRLGETRSKWQLVPVGLMLTATVVIAGRLSGDASCEDQASRSMEQTWNSTQRSELGLAIEQTAHPQAAQIVDQLSPAIDEHAERWVQARRQVCDTLSSQRHADLQDDHRLACLDDRRRELGVAIDLLAESDRHGAGRALEVIAGLGDVGRCLELDPNVERLASPRSASQARAIDRERSRLSRADGLGKMGRYEDGRILAGEVAEAAKKLNYPPLQAEAERLHGWLTKNSGDYETSMERLERAYFLARRHRHDRVARMAAIDLVYVTGVLLERHEDAERWTRDARSELDRNPSPPDEARFLVVLGGVAERRGEFERAREYFQRTLVLHESMYGRFHSTVARSLNNLCLSYAGQGLVAEARPRCERALEIYRSELGPHHPTVARTLDVLSSLAAAEHEPGKALFFARRAVTVSEQALGADHPETAAYVRSVGRLLLQADQPDEARPHLEKALEIQRATLGEEHHHLTTTLMLLATLDVRDGAIDQARARYHTTIAMLESSLGQQHTKLLAPLIDLARLEIDHGRSDAGLEHATRAHALIDPENRYDRAQTKYLLARAHWARGSEPDRALAMAADAARDYRSWMSTGAVRIYAPSGDPTVEEMEAWVKAREG
ncbi:MAG: serine/threonine-protein kinase [Myxococcota bacterium]